MLSLWWILSREVSRRNPSWLISEVVSASYHSSSSLIDFRNTVDVEKANLIYGGRVSLPSPITSDLSRDAPIETVFKG